MTRTLPVALALIAVLLPSPALAWGEYGHRTTAAIAEANLTPGARARMNALFRAEKMLGTPQCALGDIGDASVWPDCVRRDSLRWGYTAPWHYQNHNVCEAWDPESDCANGNCVSAQVERNAALLADKTLPAHVRLEALTFLVHFTGDMHMPLHSGSRNDAGGNFVAATYGIVGGRMNLHSLWDGALAERAITDGPTLVRRYSPAETAPIVAGSVADWQREAFELSRTRVYPTAQEHDACGEPVGREERALIDNEEIRSLIPEARLQIERAGLRIAALINKALG